MCLISTTVTSRTCEVCQLAKRVADCIECVTVGRRKRGDAEGITDDFEGKLRLLRMSTSLGGHDVDSYVS
ncbi:hypothetical protein WJ97_09995 [Burkholderia ubonensis]|nr:hypothetical protein WJ97_09995 [Burkholderia ubonensis]